MNPPALAISHNAHKLFLMDAMMETKENLLEGLSSLYSMESQSGSAAARLLSMWQISCESNGLLLEYLDDTEEHLLRVKDLREYLGAPLDSEQDQQTGITSQKWAKEAGTLSSVDTFFFYADAAVARYRICLFHARRLASHKVIAVLSESLNGRESSHRKLAANLKPSFHIPAIQDVKVFVAPERLPAKAGR